MIFIMGIIVNDYLVPDESLLWPTSDRGDFFVTVVLLQHPE